MGMTSGGRMRMLTITLNLWSKWYYEGNPEVDDTTYDLLYKELVELEALYPEFIDPETPTKKVGS